MLRKYAHSRKLPHHQPDFKAFFITFSTHDHWTLPGSVRQIVIDTCLAGNGRKFCLYAGVVMSDHGHVVLAPKYDANGPVSIAEIMQAIRVHLHTGSIRLLGEEGNLGRGVI